MRREREFDGQRVSASSLAPAVWRLSFSRESLRPSSLAFFARIASRLASEQPCRGGIARATIRSRAAQQSEAPGEFSAAELRVNASLPSDRCAFGKRELPIARTIGAPTIAAVTRIRMLLRLGRRRIDSSRSSDRHGSSDMPAACKNRDRCSDRGAPRAGAAPARECAPDSLVGSGTAQFVVAAPS